MTEKPSMKSRYWLSSASHSLAPCAFFTTMGKGSASRKRLPTPAGMTLRLLCQIDSDLGLFARISSRYWLRMAVILPLSAIILSFHR